MHVRLMDYCHPSRSMPTSLRSMRGRGAARSTSSPVVPLANHGPSPASAAASTTHDTCGPTWLESLVSAVRDSCSSRTSRLLPFKSQSATWKQWATESRQLSASVQPILARLTAGIGGGCWLTTPTVGNKIRSDAFARGRLPNPREEFKWPTPTARDWKSGASSQAIRDKNSRPLCEVVRYPTPTVKGNHNRAGASEKSGDGLATAVGGNLNPTFVEWLMAFPLEYTVCAAWATRKSRSSQRSHSES